MSPSLLGFNIENSQDAVQRREAAYKQAGNDVRVLPAFADADIPILVGLGVLYRRRDGSLARHPLLPTTNEDIIQFFRWAVGTDKHPLPPMVRRILCVKRDILHESVESIHTTPFMRTGEMKMLGEIETLLKNDGVKDLDAACENREPLAVLGAWAVPTLTVDIGTLKGPTCDYTSLQTQLERFSDMLASVKVSDSIQQDVLALLDDLLSLLESVKSSISTQDPAGKTTIDMLSELENTVRRMKTTMEAANSRNVKQRMEEMLEILGPQLRSVGNLVSTLQSRERETKRSDPLRNTTLPSQGEARKGEVKKTAGGSRRNRKRFISIKKTRVTRRKSRSRSHSS